MFSLPFLQKNSPQSDKYIFILFLSGEKAYGFAFEENDPENRSTLYQEHVDSFLKNAAEKVEKILANVERDLGENVYLKKTVLVLNALYTTESGAIREDFLKQIKKLLKAVDLDNLGYLNFYEVINFHFGKKYPRFHLLEESVYDYNLYILANGEVEKTTKIAKSEDWEGNFKEIAKQIEDKLLLTAFFYKKPQGHVEYKHLIEEGDLAGMFTEVYFKDKTKPAAPSAPVIEPEKPPEPSKEPEVAVEAIPMAPGFTIASTELAYKEDLREEPVFEEPVSTGKKFNLPKIKFNFVIPKFGLGLYMLVGLVIFLFGFLGYYFFFHRAEVVLSTKKESYSSEIKFEVSGKSQFAEQFSRKVSGKVEGATTGEKVTGEKATGEITVYNGLNEKRDLAEGAVFKAKNGAQFVLDDGITVPSATDSADINQGVVTKAFGKKTVSVTARDIGAEGNIDSGSKLTYGDLDEDDFYALANADFNGGVKKTVAVFSSRDSQNLEKKVLASTKSQLLTNFRSQNSSEDILFPETITTSTLKKNFSQEIGAEVSRVTLSYSGDIKAYYAPYRELVAEVQKRKLKDKEFVENTFSLAKVKLQSSKNGVYNYSALVKGKVQNLVDQPFLKSRLRGKTISSARSVLEEERNIIEYALTTKPLPLPFLPINNERISLKFTR